MSGSLFAVVLGQQLSLFDLLPAASHASSGTGRRLGAVGSVTRQPMLLLKTLQTATFTVVCWSPTHRGMLQAVWCYSLKNNNDDGDVVSAVSRPTVQCGVV